MQSSLIEPERAPAAPARSTSFAERVERVAAVAAQHAASVDANARFPHEAIAAMRTDALLGAWIPASLGGLGATLAQITAACETLGASCASTAMIFAMHQIQVASLVRHADDSEYLRHYLRAVAREQRLIASGTSEMGVGGDVRTSTCAVEREIGCVRLTKHAPVISYGNEADDILATARRAPDASPGDQVMVLLERGTFTLDQQSTWNALGFRGTSSHSFMLRACVEPSAVMATPFATIAAETMVPVSHLVWASAWLGLATDSVRRARSFVRDEARRQAASGKTAAGSVRLSELVSKLHAMRSTVREAVRVYGATMDSRDVLGSMTYAIAINNLKISASDALVDIVQEAMRVTGIAGYRNDSPVSLARALRDALGAVVMINNDRILAANATLLLASRED